MKREITVKELVDELKQRVSDSKEIDCCRYEILKLAELAASRFGGEKITLDPLSDKKKDHG